jgi:hypothetical protein
MDEARETDCYSVMPLAKGKKFAVKPTEVHGGVEIGTTKQDGLMFKPEEQKKDDDFMEKKVWEAQIRQPKNFFKPALGSELQPKLDLKLEYVWGYRARDMRNNIKYLDDGQVFYNAAALGIIMNTEATSSGATKSTQKFFNRHSNEVISTAVSPNGKIVATGEIGASPKIYAWDSSSMLVISVMSDGLTTGAANLAFSSNGEKLLATCLDESHQVCIFNVIQGILIASSKGGNNRILDAKWVNDTDFVTVGINHYQYWKHSGENFLKSIRGNFTVEITRDLLCCEYNTPNVITGSTDGSLYLWKEHDFESRKPLHTGCLDAICVNRTHVITGGKDCKIHILSKLYLMLHTLDLNQYLKNQHCVNPRPKAVDITKRGKSIIVGTMSQEIYEFSTEDSKIRDLSKFSVKDLMQSHYSENIKTPSEICGLCMMPKEDRF